MVCCDRVVSATTGIIGRRIFMRKPPQFWENTLARLGLRRIKSRKTGQRKPRVMHIEPLEPRQMLSGGTSDPVGLAQFLGQGADCGGRRGDSGYCGRGPIVFRVGGRCPDRRRHERSRLARIASWARPSRLLFPPGLFIGIRKERRRRPRAAVEPGTLTLPIGTTRKRTATWRGAAAMRTSRVRAAR